MNRQLGFFDLQKPFDKLSPGGDALERLNGDRRLGDLFDWEISRADREHIDEKGRKSAAGRKPTDRVRMFKMLVLQSLYWLSDEALEFQVTDRRTFMRFLGIDLGGAVPDAKTMWLFREQLREAKVFDQLFERFHRALATQGIKLSSGQIVDASFVEAPRQRNTREENETVKEGAVPARWTKNPAKLRQKDIDARWTQKNNEDHFGYKSM